VFGPSLLLNSPDNSSGRKNCVFQGGDGEWDTLLLPWCIDWRVGLGSEIMLLGVA